MVVTGPVISDILDNDPAVDADKVATIKAAIGCGAYRIDHEVLANAMIGFGRSSDSQNFDVAAPSES